MKQTKQILSLSLALSLALSLLAGPVSAATITATPVDPYPSRSGTSELSPAPNSGKVDVQPDYSQDAVVTGPGGTAEVTPGEWIPVEAQDPSQWYYITYDAGDERYTIFKDAAPAGRYVVKSPEETGLTQRDSAFGGWKLGGTDSLYGPGDVLQLSGNITLSATWAPCCIVFSVGSSGGTSYLDAGSAITLPTIQNGSLSILDGGSAKQVPVPDGKALAGWQVRYYLPWRSSPVYGETCAPGSRFTLTQYQTNFDAVWADDELACAITYVVNGQSFHFYYYDSQLDNGIIHLKDITDFSGVRAPSGKQFAGWTSDPDLPGFQWWPNHDYRPDRSKLTLYPVWEDMGSIHVRFNSYNGSSGEERNISVAPGRALLLPTPGELGFTTPAGQVFDYWTISGTHYAPGDTFEVYDGANIDAIWRAATAEDREKVFSFDGGKLVFQPGRASYKDLVTITVQPDSGYQLKKLELRDEANTTVALQKVTESKYSFRMPDTSLSINASFEKNSAAPAQPAPSASDFTDVPPTHWAAKFIAWAVENKIVSGMGDGTFAPDAPCTNAQIISMLWNAAGKPVPAIENPYSDVAAGAWYYNAALWAYEQGMVDTGAFRADTGCTRAMTAEYLWKQAGSPAAEGTGFTDVPAGAPYARAVAWAAANQITSGMGDGTFAPDMICTRAQIVTFIYNAMARL